MHLTFSFVASFYSKTCACASLDIKLIAFFIMNYLHIYIIYSVMLWEKIIPFLIEFQISKSYYIPSSHFLRCL